MKFIKVSLAIFISLLLFSQTGSAQESSAENTKQSSTGTEDVTGDFVFHKVSAGDNKKVFRDAVTGHIVSNKGIQNFYAVPAVETKWLGTIINSEIEWHKQLQKLEQTYRKTFQRRAELKSGQSDRAVRIGNYSLNISKLEKEIAEIRRQIVQINVDQQVYINSLRKTPITTLVAIKTLYTPDLMSSKDKLDVLNSAIFNSMEEPVLGHISSTYGNNITIPFQSGHIRVTYMYPENITYFDSEANEHVYLFLRVEAYPFSTGASNDGTVEDRGVGVEILSNIKQIQSYLNTKEVGDKRLMDWLIKEYSNQKLNNDHLLNLITGKLGDFKMFRNGLKQSISELRSKVKIIVAQRDSLVGSGDAEIIEAEYKQAKNLYHQFYATRNVLTQEKYTLENDVMFSFFHMEGESTKKNANTEQKQMLDSNVASNIPISGRPLKDIFTDILITANQKRKLNLQNYRERIYRANEEQTQLIQGALEWEVKSEEFSILKLTRGNVGSRSHFVLHLAKRSSLISKPGFPAPKSGVCKSTLLFKRGKNAMRNSSKPALDKLAKCLRKYPKQMIQITGHTDPLKPDYGEGSKFSNVTLGLKRAEAVMDSLIALDFNPGRFIVVSRGAKDPVAIGREKKDLEKNRRVEIISTPKE
jgi:outer membrane protein OmpA-like peptidoglycan-associated protein/esterase/lipase